jgi:hypothetical protein
MQYEAWWDGHKKPPSANKKKSTTPIKGDCILTIFHKTS